MARFKELVPYTISVTSTPKLIGDFINDSVTDKKTLQSLSYVEISAYQADGDTVRGAIDLVWHYNTANVRYQPLLAGQGKTWDGMTYGAANAIWLYAGTTQAAMLILGFDE